MERLPSFPLRDYRLEWEVRDENSKVIASGAQALPDLAQAQTIAGKLPPPAQNSALRLHLTLLNPMGLVAAENNVDWRRSEAGSQPAPASAPITGGTPAPAQ
jgi:hypothetical protein